MLLKWTPTRLARWVACASLLVAVGAGRIARAADFPITTANDAGSGSLRQAILDAAVSGDTATFDAGLAGMSLVNGGSILFDKNLTLIAPNVNGLVVPHDIALQQGLIYNSTTAGEYATFSGVLSGAAGITKTGEGTLILSGNNTFMGGTLLEIGQLRLKHNNALGTGPLTVNNLGNTLVTIENGVNIANNIILETTLVIAPDPGATATLSGIISDNGTASGLNKGNVSTLILSGANTFTGGVYVSDDSTIRAEHSTALGSGTLTVAGALRLDLADGLNVGNHIFLGNEFIANVDSGAAILNGIIDDTTLTSGFGSSLTKTGAGTLILGGANTYTGGTTVSAGFLVGNTDSLQGDIFNNASVIFDQDGFGTYAGAMSGIGSLTKIGANTLIMTGDSNYTGETAVNVGELQVRGSITSNVTVEEAGVVSGAGRVGNIFNRGLVQPGNFDTGRLRVDGHFQQVASGQTDIDIDDGGTTPGTNNDHIDVAGVASLDGTLNVIAAPGAFANGTQYTVLTAAGGVFGTFANVTDNLALFDVEAIYQGNDVLIELQRILMLEDVGATANQRAVGAALDRIALTATGGLQTLINDLGAASPADQQLALSQLSGDAYGTTQTMGLQAGMQFQNSVNDRLINNGQFLNSNGDTLAALSESAGGDDWIVRGQSPSDQWRGWAQGFGTSGRFGSDGNAPGGNYRQGGVAVGLDFGRDETGVIGISNGNAYLDFNQGNGASGRLEAHQVGLYLLKRVDAWYLIGSTNYGYNDFDVTRTVPGGSVQGEPIAHQFGAYAESGWSVDRGLVRIQPLAALQYQLLAQQGFTETGGPGALTVSGTQADSLRTHLGGRVAFAGLEDGRGRLWSPYVHGRWVAELLGDDRLVFAAINGAPVGGSFVSAGNGLGTHYGMFGAGLNVQLSDRWSGYSNYDLQVSRSLTAHTGSGGLSYAW
ncbi:MAG: autotransporter domain-containing protein [Planctomycetota bacterium]